MISVDSIQDLVKKELDRDGHQAILIGHSIFRRRELKSHSYMCLCSEYCRAKNKYVEKKMELSRLRNGSRNISHEEREKKESVVRNEMRRYRTTARQILDQFFPITIR